MQTSLGLTQGEGLLCHAEPIRGYGGHDMEGGIPVVGTPLSPLEMSWASINKTSMKQGAHVMTAMTCLTLPFTTPHTHCYRLEVPTYQRDSNI